MFKGKVEPRQLSSEFSGFPEGAVHGLRKPRVSLEGAVLGVLESAPTSSKVLVRIYEILGNRSKALFFLG